MKTYTVRLWNQNGGSLLCFKGCIAVESPDGRQLEFTDADGLRHRSNLPYDVAEEKTV